MDLLFKASSGPACPHMSVARPIAIPEKLSLAQPVFSWAYPCPVLPSRLKTGPAQPIFSLGLP